MSMRTVYEAAHEAISVIKARVDNPADVSMALAFAAAIQMEAAGIKTELRAHEECRTWHNTILSTWRYITGRQR